MWKQALIAVLITAASVDAAPPSTQVKVRVVQVGYPPGVEEALGQHTARLLFARIGIDVDFNGGADAILLRVWDEAPNRTDRYALGTATLSHTGTRLANVFIDRVRLFSGGSDPRKIGILLGYGMAHELGHVLRDEPEHSPAGVMKSCWSQGDKDRMLLGIIGFTPADAERMLEVLALPRPVRLHTGE